jgi:hypothetical protein
MEELILYGILAIVFLVFGNGKRFPKPLRVFMAVLEMLAYIGVAALVFIAYVLPLFESGEAGKAILYIAIIGVIAVPLTIHDFIVIKRINELDSDMNSVIKDMRRNGASEAEIAMYKANSDSPIYNKKNRFQVLKIVGITLVVAIVLGITFFALSLLQ